ncbi:AlbA family DNA-binding domain-containing protein [Algoriphagus lacus]|nr:ATP-binding protein [Algoriphagus lacus]
MNKMKPTKFDQDFVNKLIKQKEGKTLDFKQKINSKEKIAKTLGALANTEGGFILVGLSDKKKITGIDPEEERYMIESANEEFCVPRVSIAVKEIKVRNEKYPMFSDEEEISLLLVIVKKSEGPIIFCKSSNGEMKAYKRVHDQTLAV